MLNFVISFVVSCLIVTVCFDHLTLIESLQTSPGGVIGTFVGAMAASYAAFTPFIRGLPSRFSSWQGRTQLSEPPTKVTGKVLNIQDSGKLVSLRVEYAGNEHDFKVDPRAIPESVQVGSSIMVFYDASNPTIAYLDFMGSIEAQQQAIIDSQSVFKVENITPRFDISAQAFEIVGQLYGEPYEGQRASFIHNIPHQVIHQIIPGRLFPCKVTTQGDQYSIELMFELQ